MRHRSPKQAGSKKMKTRPAISADHLAVLVPLCLLLMSGCSVTANATVPTAPALEAAPQSAPHVNLSAVKDGRGTEKAGAIGAAHFNLKWGLNDYVQSSFANGLTHSGYAVNAISGPTPQQGVKTVVVTVQSASVASFDAILQPARGEVGIAVQVFGSADAPVYAHSYSGTYSETVGIHGIGGYEEDVGRIIATAADQAVSHAMADPSFQAAIKTMPAPASQVGLSPKLQKPHEGS
jgi:hypothetical protein